MSGCCSAVRDQFDGDYVARELRARDRGRGGPTSAKLIDLLASRDVSGIGIGGATLLDVGAGLGDIPAALFARGIAAATHVEASTAYSEAARERAYEEEWADRVRFEVGDFVELADRLPRADIVTLDRVVCCYADMPALIDRVAGHARHALAVSAPRDGWPLRAFIAVKNLARQLRGTPFRTFVHSWAAMDDRLEADGFARGGEASTLVWRVVIYRRRESGLSSRRESRAAGSGRRRD